MRVKLDNSEFGIPNCWYNITRKHSRIDDLISDLTIKFDLPEIQLEIDGFLLLENESTLDLLRENDLISVIPKSRKRLCTFKAVEKGSGENAISLESAKVDGSDLKELKPDVVSRTFSESDSSSEGSSEGTSESSDQVEPSQVENSKKIVDSVKESDDSSSDSDSESSGSSGSVSESDQESSVDSAKTVTQDVTVPPVMSYYINPPMSLVGKNKRKLVPKMLNQERVHLHFEGIEKSTVQGENKAQEEEIKAPDNVVFSTVRLYDDEPCAQNLSASQKRRIRRKKAQIYKTLESLNDFNDKDDGGIPKEQGLELKQSITNISQNNNNRGSGITGITNISELIPGKKIAYQILEMSFSYQPEISGYKEAIVMAVDYLNKMVTLKSLETIQQEASMEEVDGQETPFRKFELPPDDDYTPMAPQNEVFIVCFNDLISVKILE